MNRAILEREPATKDLDPQMLTPPAIERLAEVSAPTLVIIGDLDMPYLRDRAEKMAREIPGARLEVIKNAAHMPNMDTPPRSIAWSWSSWPVSEICEFLAPPTRNSFWHTMSLTSMTEKAVRPPDSYVDLLTRPLFAHLATVTPDGAPLVNPMWFLWDDEASVLKLTHTNQRHNFRHLQSNPRVALSITDPNDQYRYMQIRGVLDKVEDDPTGAFYQTLQQRYRGTTSEVKDRDVRVILTIRPTNFKARG
jgi:PPOX class probable F420-dependent enzyme